MLPDCQSEKADPQKCPEQGWATFMCVLMAATCRQQLTAAITPRIHTFYSPAGEKRPELQQFPTTEGHVRPFLFLNRLAEHDLLQSRPQDKRKSIIWAFSEKVTQTYIYVFQPQASAGPLLGREETIIWKFCYKSEIYLHDFIDSATRGCLNHTNMLCNGIKIPTEMWKEDEL